MNRRWLIIGLVGLALLIGVGTFLLLSTRDIRLEDKPEDYRAQREMELNKAPILSLLPHEESRFRVEWNFIDNKGRYVLDITLFYGYGETSEDATEKYKPLAESWVRSQNPNTKKFVLRYRTEPITGE